MKGPIDEAMISQLLKELPKRAIPQDLVAMIEQETFLKKRWWESEAFRLRWLPAIVGTATAVGALWLSKAHVNPRPEALIPVAAAPHSGPVTQHAHLLKEQSSNDEKGDSREN